MKKTDKITIRVTEMQKNKLTRHAKLKGISTGQLIRDWVEVLLKVQLT